MAKYIFPLVLVAMASLENRPLSAADESPPPRSAEETKTRGELAGLWKGYVVAGKGEKPNEGPVKLELTITADRISGIQLQQTERVDHGSGEFLLGLATKPRTLDGIKKNERGRKDEWLGIFSLDGETLKWCVKKKERPEAFETGGGQFLMVLKREKPSGKPTE